MIRYLPANSSQSYSYNANQAYDPAGGRYVQSDLLDSMAGSGLHTHMWNASAGQIKMAEAMTIVPKTIKISLWRMGKAPLQLKQKDMPTRAPKINLDKNQPTKFRVVVEHQSRSIHSHEVKYQ
ncbi:hypothetical protein V4C85_16725 [Ralstonia solanacearum]|uniref:hypothetical protein n=1 Tax=Ralstonia solanacearum TaxID=305 RepID=UPI000B119D01|nr:hypothetical protein [Ralstonia solanacearum]